MTNMNELIEKLETDGYNADVVKDRYASFLKLKIKVDACMLTGRFYDLCNEADEDYNFICGFLWALNMVGTISDVDRNNITNGLIKMMYGGSRHEE